MRIGRVPRLRRGDGLLRPRRLLDALYIAVVAYLCARALNPNLLDRAPSWLRWFGEPGSYPTVAIVLALPILHLVVRRLVGDKPAVVAPLIVIAAMAASALVLGMSAYWRCSGNQAPFFAPLSWTLGLFVGNVENAFGGDGSGCAAEQMPAALEIARLLAITTTLTTALAAALTLFRSQLDRFAIWRAHSLTVVVGVDEETVPMIRAIMGTLGAGEALVTIAGNADSDAARMIRNLGAKVREVNLDEPESMSTLRIWSRLTRLYLLSEDPVQNLQSFVVIDAEVAKARGELVRLPLIVRIDDPWQAEVWRRSFLAETERRWVADAVGRHEITAAKLVRHMTTKRAGGDEMEPPSTIVLCGLHPLTYAVASELAQLRRDQKLYANPQVTPPRQVVVFAREAASFVHDHQVRQARMVADGAPLPLNAHDYDPTVDAITEYLRDKDLATYAVVLGDPLLETEGTRMASRFPRLRVYMASAVTRSLVNFSIVGRLYGFPINMELERDAPQDAWERAAELIHEHYSSGRDRTRRNARPWKDLDPFFKQSNRRQLLNTLWMVETIADHTWNSLESGSAEELPSDFERLDALKQLEVLGFDEHTVQRMIETEHDDWYRYYKVGGWRYAQVRDDDQNRHDRLLPWRELLATNPDCLEDARKSLVSTLINLRGIGYRSVPRPHTSKTKESRKTSGVSGWHRYTRRGEVTAQKRAHGWTWTTATGASMEAQPGDWAVTDDAGAERSVAAGVFEMTHEQIGPERFRRTGTVLARCARGGEVISTLEGDVVAEEGDWVVQGSGGEQWPVPNSHFRENYEIPDDAHDAVDRGTDVATGRADR